MTLLLLCKHTIFKCSKLRDLVRPEPVLMLQFFTGFIKQFLKKIQNNNNKITQFKKKKWHDIVTNYTPVVPRKTTKEISHV